MADVFVWVAKEGSKEGNIEIHSLHELLDVLVKIPLENVDDIVSQNKEGLEKWIKTHFPDNLQMIAHFKEDYTLQQWREQLIRDLRAVLA
jgi:fructose-1,6-bisphosphatase